MEIQKLLVVVYTPIIQFINFNGICQLRNKFHYIIDLPDRSDRPLIKVDLPLACNGVWDGEKLEQLYQRARELRTSGFDSLRVKIDPPRVDWRENGVKCGRIYMNAGWQDNIVSYSSLKVSMELNYLFTLPFKNDSTAHIQLSGYKNIGA